MVLWYLDYFHLYLGLLGNEKSAARWSAALENGNESLRRRWRHAKGTDTEFLRLHTYIDITRNTKFPEIRMI
jgi:hypothetical protein